MMDEKYSEAWVRDQAEACGATSLDHHNCSLCGAMVRYLIAGDYVTFRGACGCSWSPDRASSFGEIADWLAMQCSDEVRDKIMEGLS